MKTNKLLNSNLPIESPEAAEIRHKISVLASKYWELVHRKAKFSREDPKVPVSGKVFGPEEIQNLVDSALDFWLTTGRFNNAFEESLASIIGVKHILTTNSGSSANLLAVSSLCSPIFKGRAMSPGDEVITCAAGFPTTVNPIIINNLVPVFVDVEIPSYNIDASQLDLALSHKTRGIVIAHTMGNPFNLDLVMDFANKHALWVVEDCCDGLGSKYKGKHIGTFGNVGTYSFYPAHQITMGEGGAVFTNDGKLRRAVESIRDWGRDCYCPPGYDNTCGKRFGWKLGNLPKGYDHKYTYSHLGYNLKLTDMQAAVGLAQLDKLDSFVAARAKNFLALKNTFSDLEDFFILPEANQESEPSWFGFLITVRDGAPFTRDQFVRKLNKMHIATRFLFGGNLLKQPYMGNRTFRTVGNLENTNKIMRDTLWIGLFPGIGLPEINYISEVVHKFCKR
ncbi:MAG: lipopolysaccharide biosynthesis protein RfbH [Magnetovibrio sp.]|nr:lipopolysaccharide biosynthesis protein RfbH [Magnetovibrio sp.]